MHTQAYVRKCFCTEHFVVVALLLVIFHVISSITVPVTLLTSLQSEVHLIFYGDSMRWSNHHVSSCFTSYDWLLRTVLYSHSPGSLAKQA